MEAAQDQKTRDSVNGIVTFPLVSLHVHRRRRLIEQSSSSELLEHSYHVETNESESQATLTHIFPDRLRPSQYPRHSNKRRRLVESYHESTVLQHQQQVASLYQGYGTHFVDLWIGTPPQRQTLIVDTGSATTAFPCSGCSPDRCGRNQRFNPYFQESRSTTFQAIDRCSDCSLGECSIDSDLDFSRQGETIDGDHPPQQCTLGVSYQEGSNWTAFESMDQVYVGGLHTQSITASTQQLSPVHHERLDGLNPYAAPEFSFQLRFGCITQMSGHFRSQPEDGIMGCDIGKPSIWNQMYLQGKIASRAFSLCFQRQPSHQAAGAMTLGGTDTRLHQHPMVYSIPSSSHSHDEQPGVFFSVHIRNVYLSVGENFLLLQNNKDESNIERIRLDNAHVRDRKMIIDSGTTDTFLTHHIREGFEVAWTALTGSKYHNQPTKITKEEVNKLPTIYLQFKGDEDSNQVLLQGEQLHLLPLAGDLDPKHPLDVVLVVPPSHYMEYEPNTQRYISGLYLDEPEGSVLGANAMMLHDIFFDVEHNRIGWAESNCDMTQLIAPFVTDESRFKPLPLNLRGRPPGKPRDKPSAIQEHVNVAPTGKVLESLTFCSTLSCRMVLVFSIFLVVISPLILAISRQYWRKRSNTSVVVTTTPTNTTTNLSFPTPHNISSLPHRSLPTPYNTSSLPQRPRRMRRESNLSRSISEALPACSVSSDTGSSGDDCVLPTTLTSNNSRSHRHFTRGQILRSRSHAQHL